MKRRLGVTLIEMLIAMSVVSFVLLAVVSVLTSSQRLWNNEVGNAKSMQEANLAMDLICQEASQAVSTGTDNYGKFYFVMPKTDAQGNVLLTLIGGLLGATAGPTGAEFYTSNANGTANSGTILWRANVASDGKTTPDAVWSKLPGNTLLKFPGVTALTYTTTGLPANTVQISLTVTTKEGGQSSSYTDTRIVYLSNHD